MGENGREGFGFFGADDVGGEFDLGLENMAVEEEDGTERLVLCRSSYLFFGGEVGEVGLYFVHAHIFGVAFIVEEDEAPDPFLVGLFGAEGIIPKGMLRDV